MAAPIFTEEALELLATPLSIRLERAAKTRNRAELEWIQAQLDMECLAIYDPYIQWAGVLQTFLLDRLGRRGHDEALLWAAEHAFRPFVRELGGLGVRERVEALAGRLRASGSTFWVEEDEVRVRFRLESWGGAARQWLPPAERRRADGRYHYERHGSYEPPASFVWLEGAGPLTQGRARLPCFFATEILFLEIQAIELNGFPIAVVTLPDAPDAPAFLDVFKDAAEIPEEAYARVGTAKPKTGLPRERGRLFTDDELECLGVPLSLQVEAAAGAGDWERLHALSAGMDAELVSAKDPLGILIAGLLTWIARHLGEDAVEAALERTAEVVMTPFVDAVRDLHIADAIPLWAMVWRAHGSTYWIEERDETFVLRGRPLGACARMWSHAYQPRVERISDSRVRYPTFGCYDAPASFHLMREPRGITHMKTGYPVYSTHCHMLHELFAIDQLGHPLWVELHPLHDCDAETVHIHYKDPAAWPERYYQMLGREKR